MDFLGKFRQSEGVDKQQHADLLREALADSPGARQEIADAIGVSYRTVGNWSARQNPTMPSAKDREVIRRILGPYDQAGDPVESALDRSELADWRASDVKTLYKRHLHEQRREEATG